MARLPDNWDKTEPINTEPPEEQLRDAIIESDCEAVKVGSVVLDGKVHRFKVGGDTASEKSGWYIGYSDHVPAGSFGNWRKGLTLDWCAESGKEFSPSERAAYAETIARARQVRDEEEAKYHAEIAKVAQKIWDTAQECTGHPYLEKKQIKNHGLKVTGETENPRLIVPIYVGDKIASLQYIDADGNKQYHGGGEVKCGYCPIIDSSNSNELAGPIYIAEGYATAASIHEATDCVSIMALNAGNLTNVAKYIRQIYGEQQQIVIVGDNDQNGTGQKAANEAGAAIGARVIIPPYVSNDANDVAVIYGVAALKAMLTDYTPWLLQADEFSQNPAPINWLVKHWLQKKGLAMMFGASGTGKTFVALDWVLRIASNIDDWAGNKIHHGAVVYLAGEGHQGLRARIAGWKQYHHVDHLNAWISSSGCDLNTDAGLRQTVKEIQDLNITGSQGIAVIVVDTLHRFLSGDENSAQDAKTMLDSCSELSRLFGCTVILIHHTGVNEDAQNRARGSSSWRGALDNQIQVSSDGGDIVLKMVKNKDGELADDIYLERIPVNIGWHDEDGEPVSTIVLETDDNGTVDKKVATLTKNQQLGLQCFREAAEKYGLLNGGHFAGVDIRDWRNEFYETYKSGSINSKRVTFNRVADDLMVAGRLTLITIDKNKVYQLSGDFCQLEINNIERKLKMRKNL